MMFSSNCNCIVFILLVKICIGDVSMISIYTHVLMSHTCQYSVI